MFSYRYIILGFSFFLCSSLMAQTTQWRDIYKAKSKDTLYGIARNYGITLEQLLSANPEMGVSGYELKKGTFVFIPFVKTESATAPVNVGKNDNATTTNAKAIKVGIMLPLHDNDGDGRRMVEYYRGFLLACDSLKKQNISIDITALNVPINADLKNLLSTPKLKQCDIIYGPLYTHQVKMLGDFCLQNDIKLVIPFSINSDAVTKNKNICQVYQTVDDINNLSIESFVQLFRSHHPVFVDCNDLTSKKGIFTMALRNKLESLGIQYNITNINSDEAAFMKAFSRTKPNVVILNTSRSPELGIVLAKLNGLVVDYPAVNVSLFGYTEWLMYTRNNLDNFFKFNTYIPTTFYYNPLSVKTKAIEAQYNRWFQVGMQYNLPRFALTGYDHAQFFLSRVAKYGKKFSGLKNEINYQSVQTPLNFKRLNKGGMQNNSFMLVHYTPQGRIELVNN